MLIMNYELNNFNEEEVRFTTSRCDVKDALVFLHVEEGYDFNKFISTLEALRFWFEKEVFIVHEGEPRVYEYE